MKEKESTFFILVDFSQKGVRKSLIFALMNKTQNPFDLSGKVAIVTGSSKGIGEAIALLLAQHGAKVVISSRKQDAVDAVSAQMNEQGYDTIGIACNVGKAEDCQSLVDKTIAHYGGIDILVNNAATNPFFGPIEAHEEAAFDKIMEVNVKAPWRLSNACLASMQARGGGSIINISSVEGEHPGMGLSIYSVSKSALIMLTKNQAKEWGKHGIRSNVLCPGLIKTKFSKALWSNEKMLNHMERSIPSGRIGMPEEMAGPVLLMASDAGSYMTGSVVTADGGYLIGG